MAFQSYVVAGLRFFYNFQILQNCFGQDFKSADRPHVWVSRKYPVCIQVTEMNLVMQDTSRWRKSGLNASVAS